MAVSSSLCPHCHRLEVSHSAGGPPSLPRDPPGAGVDAAQAVGSSRRTGCHSARCRHRRRERHTRGAEEAEKGGGEVPPLPSHSIMASCGASVVREDNGGGGASSSQVPSGKRPPPAHDAGRLPMVSRECGTPHHWQPTTQAGAPSADTQERRTGKTSGNNTPSLCVVGSSSSVSRASKEWNATGGQDASSHGKRHRNKKRVQEVVQGVQQYDPKGEEASVRGIPLVGAPCRATGGHEMPCPSANGWPLPPPCIHHAPPPPPSYSSDKERQDRCCSPTKKKEKRVVYASHPPPRRTSPSETRNEWKRDTKAIASSIASGTDRYSSVNESGVPCAPGQGSALYGAPSKLPEVEATWTMPAREHREYGMVEREGGLPYLNGSTVKLQEDALRWAKKKKRTAFHPFMVVDDSPGKVAHLQQSVGTKRGNAVEKQMEGSGTDAEERPRRCRHQQEIEETVSATQKLREQQLYFEQQMLIEKIKKEKKRLESQRLANALQDEKERLNHALQHAMNTRSAFAYTATS